MVFPHAKEVEDIGLTNQSCKISKICLVIPKGEAMDPLGVECQFSCKIRRKSKRQAINFKFKFGGTFLYTLLQ
jgi:hypothetical protein